MKKQPISAYVTTHQVFAEIKRLTDLGTKDQLMRTVALSLMPKGVKWFESGEDWAFALWLTRLAKAAKDRGKHQGATYTFKTGKARF